MCGSSNAQKQISAQQQKFYSELQQSYGTEFAGQQSILSSLTKAFTPIVNAGPNQQGFSAQENAALNTAAMTNTGQNYKHAAQALNENLAARGGGNEFLPSGNEEVLRGNLAGSASQELSREQLGITQANYAQGRQNFFNAAGALSGEAGLYNPAGFAGEATGAGSAAASLANQMQAQGNQWIGALGGALGGAASAFGAYEGAHH